MMCVWTTLFLVAWCVGADFVPEIGRVLQFNTSGKRTAVFLHSENRGKLPNNETNIQTSWIFRCYVVSFRFRITVRGGLVSTRDGADVRHMKTGEDVMS